jgi:hypothetical protein
MFQPPVLTCKERSEGLQPHAPMARRGCEGWQFTVPFPAPEHPLRCVHGAIVASGGDRGHQQVARYPLTKQAVERNAINLAHAAPIRARQVKLVAFQQKAAFQALGLPIEGQASRLSDLFDPIVQPNNQEAEAKSTWHLPDSLERPLPFEAVPAAHEDECTRPRPVEKQVFGCSWPAARREPVSLLAAFAGHEITEQSANTFDIVTEIADTRIC